MRAPQSSAGEPGCASARGFVLCAFLLVTGFALSLSACATVRAERIVLVDAGKRTDCAELEVEYRDGRYSATGCGQTLVYECRREVGTGVGKPAAMADAGCRIVDGAAKDEP